MLLSTENHFLPPPPDSIMTADLAAPYEDKNECLPHRALFPVSERTSDKETSCVMLAKAIDESPPQTDLDKLACTEVEGGPGHTQPPDTQDISCRLSCTARENGLLGDGSLSCQITLVTSSTGDIKDRKFEKVRRKSTSSGTTVVIEGAQE